jgi:hypothetical protein
VHLQCGLRLQAVRVSIVSQLAEPDGVDGIGGEGDAHVVVVKLQAYETPGATGQ